MFLAASSRLEQKLKSSPVPIFKHYSVLAQDEKLIALLKCCKKTSDVFQIHCYMVKTGLDHVPFTLSKLIASSILDVKYAASVFSCVHNPNLFMHNTMLRGYSSSDDPKQSFGLFNKLRGQGIILDQFSFITTLKACGRELAIGFGQGIHGVILKSGHILLVDVKNSLLHTYGVCGRIDDAHKLFSDLPQTVDIVSWNTLMGGYLRVSQPTVVLDLFLQMSRVGAEISISTILNAFSAISGLGNSITGETLHGYCLKIGFCTKLNVVTALVDMYINTGNLVEGSKIFYGVAEKDIVLWNCLIDGYARNGLLEESIALLGEMKDARLKPNSSTLAGLLSTCAASGALNAGQFIYNYVEEEGVVLDTILGTALVDMYAKCGLLEKAVDIFNKIERKDVKSWTAMISGFGAHGQVRDAIALFYMMEKENCIPNEVTFLAILSACSHGGLVMEGMNCFKKMVEEYRYSPTVEHFGCVIDLLARAGLLEEAHRFMKSFQVKGDAATWRALLAACRVYGDVAMGECVKRVLLETYDDHPSDLILLSNTYAIAGRLPDYTRIRNEEEKADAKVEKGKKEAGCSRIEMDGKGIEHYIEDRYLKNKLA